MKPITDQLADCPLRRNTPFGMTNVSSTEFSIARRYGGIIFGCDRYTYIPPTDELIRDDVLRWWNKKCKVKPAKPDAPQTALL